MRLKEYTTSSAVTSLPLLNLMPSFNVITKLSAALAVTSLARPLSYSGTKSGLKLISGSQPGDLAHDVGLGHDVLAVDDVVGTAHRAHAQDAAGLARPGAGGRRCLGCRGVPRSSRVGASVAVAASVGDRTLGGRCALLRCRFRTLRAQPPHRRCPTSEDQLPTVEPSRAANPFQDRTPFHFPLVSSAPPVSATPSCDGL